ncbi:hypothetical protein BY996DRAFT_6443696 [Phakopsora pachyrhizi]|nr:hypothetical protein BY996DRAFT_6443696 [Phakopsora pachyrhizi]
MGKSCLPEHNFSHTNNIPKTKLTILSLSTRSCHNSTAIQTSSENIEYDRDGSAINDEGSKEIIQEFDFESCEIPDGSAAAPAIDSAYPRWMEIILLQDKGSGRRLYLTISEVGESRMYSGSMGSRLSSS